MTIKAERNPRLGLTLDGKGEITLTVDKGALEAIEGLRDKELSVEIKPWAEKRTKTQNAYFWALLGELARKLGIKKEDAYRHYIRDYGRYECIPVKDEAVPRFIAAWQKNGLGWICERIRESKLKGYSTMIAYYGTSTYTTEEMSEILEPLIQDCNEQGIATTTLEQALELKNENDL